MPSTGPIIMLRALLVAVDVPLRNLADIESSAGAEPACSAPLGTRHPFPASHEPDRPQVRDSDGHQRARQHVNQTALRHGKEWGRPLTEAEHAESARVALDRILVQVIWPANITALGDLDACALQRPLPAWAPAKSGVFRSSKLDGLVQFDSELELLMLRQFDADARVIDYKEQPFTTPYVVDGEGHEYTPDVIVQLHEGKLLALGHPQEVRRDQQVIDAYLGAA